MDFDLISLTVSSSNKVLSTVFGTLAFFYFCWFSFPLKTLLLQPAFDFSSASALASALLWLLLRFWFLLQPALAFACFSFCLGFSFALFLLQLPALALSASAPISAYFFQLPAWLFLSCFCLGFSSASAPWFLFFLQLLPWLFLSGLPYFSSASALFFLQLLPWAFLQCLMVFASASALAFCFSASSVVLWFVPTNIKWCCSAFYHLSFSRMFSQQW